MAYIAKAKTDEWETPQDLFDKLNEEFHFTLDVCATKDNAKAREYFTREQDGLKQDWSGHTVWCNPPYGRQMSGWIQKCYEHSIGGWTAVMLIPSRTDTRVFHKYVFPYAEVRFLKGRLKFGWASENAPFASAIVIFRPAAKEKEK